MGAVVSDHVTPSPAIPHLLYEREVEQLTPHTNHYAHDNPITLSKGSLVLLDFPGLVSFIGIWGCLGNLGRPRSREVDSLADDGPSLWS
jgi:hypothetical protein